MTDKKEDVSLTSVCSVCSSPAAPHLHYGAVSCYSCRAFFRRGQPKQVRCIFGHGQCQIGKQNRTNCKLCRYRRCLEVGMKPEKVDHYLNKRKEREARLAAGENPDCADDTSVKSPKQSSEKESSRAEKHAGSKNAFGNNERINAKEPPATMERNIDSSCSPRQQINHIGNHNSVKPVIKTAENKQKESYNPNYQIPFKEEPPLFTDRTTFKEESKTDFPTRFPTRFPRSPDYHRECETAMQTALSDQSIHPKPLGPAARPTNYSGDNRESPFPGLGQFRNFPIHNFLHDSNNYSSMQTNYFNSRRANPLHSINEIIPPPDSYITNGRGGFEDFRNKVERSPSVSPRAITSVRNQSVQNSEKNKSSPDWQDFNGSPTLTRKPNLSLTKAELTRSLYPEKANHHLTSESYQREMRGPISPSNGISVTINEASDLVQLHSTSKYIHNGSQSREPQMSPNSLPYPFLPGAESWKQTCSQHQKKSSPEQNGRRMDYQTMKPNFSPTTSSFIQNPSDSHISRSFEGYQHIESKSHEDLQMRLGTLNFPKYQGEMLSSPPVSNKTSVIRFDERSHGTQQQTRSISTQHQDVKDGDYNSGTKENSTLLSVIRHTQSTFAEDSRKSTIRENHPSVIRRNIESSYANFNNSPTSISDQSRAQNFYSENDREFGQNMVHGLHNSSNGSIETSPQLMDFSVDYSMNLDNDYESGDSDENIELLNDFSTKEKNESKVINSKRKMSDEESDGDTEGNISPISEALKVPLKKRQKMLQIPYATGHALNKKMLPVMPFTFEEEFQVVDYIFRIENYQNSRFEFVCKNFPRYRELTAGFVYCTHMGRKIPFNKQIEMALFNMGLEFTKQSCKESYQEMNSISSDVRREVLNTSYPALYVVMWGILEGNTQEKTWMDQHKKTLHITKENHSAIKDNILGLENVRSISLKDQERFTSPWAVKMEDEEKFERTIALIGRLLKDDLQLQALYHMFVMMCPSSNASDKIQMDQGLVEIQGKLCQLIYRYLSAQTDFTYTKSGYSSEDSDSARNSPSNSTTNSSIMNLSEDVDEMSAGEKTSLLINLVDDLHDCVDIMQRRSLLLQTGKN